jgi:acyl-CoA synthetase (NDP forming)
MPKATRSTPRPLYRHSELDRVLNPGSIAIIGASPKPGSFGDRVLGHLGTFTGSIFLINPKYERIGERPCYASLRQLPSSPDCIAVAVPREAVEPIVRDAASVRAGGVILYASGYAEMQRAERIEQQQRLTAIANETGLKIIGPNCLGIVNYLRKARISFAEFPKPREQHGVLIGIASQSGAMSQAMSQALERGIGVSHAFSSGNQADVDIADLVSYLADEASCQAIACAFEGMTHPRRLLEAAQIAWRNGKPLLIHKIATGQAGAATAMAHTGSPAGFDAAYRAAFERGGAIVIDEFEGLMEAASFFAKAPSPSARGVAVVATSGGAAIMAADKAELHGVPLPQPSERVQRVLSSVIPEFGSTRNPCDVTGQVVSRPQSLWQCAEALLSDPAYGALIAPQTVVSEILWQPRIDALQAVSKLCDKITCNVLLSNWLQGPGLRESEQYSHVAVFRSMDRCFRTLAAWHDRADRRARGERRLLRRSPAEAQRQAAELIASAQNDRLSKLECETLLQLYGISSKRAVEAPTMRNGIELVFATRIDPGLGPLITVRRHDTRCAIRPDAVLDLAPINFDEALRLLEKVVSASCTQLERLAELAVRISELADDQQQSIAQTELHSLLQMDGGVYLAGASIGTAA